MGTKYSNQTISGYNTSPPPDDGSTTSNNKITWNSTIKAKLSDPVKALAESVNTALLSFTDFSTTVAASNYTTIASDHMKTIEASNTTTILLMDASSAGSGYIVGVVNVGTSNVTVSCATNSDTINGSTNSLTLAPQRCIFFKTSGVVTGYQIIADFNDYTSSVISVADYGAIGNGSDEYTKINAAISAAANKILLFPYTASGYGFGTNITVPANVQLMFDPGARLVSLSSATITYTGLIGQPAGVYVTNKTEPKLVTAALAGAAQFGQVFQITGGAGTSSNSRVALNGAAQTGGGGTEMVQAGNFVAQQNAADSKARVIVMELDINNNKADDALTPTAAEQHIALDIYSGGTKIVGPAAIAIQSTNGATNAWQRGVWIKGDSIASGGYAINFDGVSGGGGAVVLTDQSKLGLGTSSPQQMLHVVGGSLVTGTTDGQGGQYEAPFGVISASTYSVASTDYTIVNIYSAGAVTVTMPNAAASTRRRLVFTSTQAVTISAGAANIISLTGGLSSTIVSGAGKWAVLVCDGTNWRTVMAN
jgi:hypothetical protein